MMLALIAPSAAMGAATTAGTSVPNTAYISYKIEGASATGKTNTAYFTVSELLEVSVTWLDASNITVVPGDNAAVLTFSLNNTGNGNDSYSLSVNSSVAGSGFTPQGATIYLDTNGNGHYDSGDALYIAGTGDPALSPNESITVFVVASIPEGSTVGALGSIEFTALSKTVTGATAGDIHPGLGDGGTDLVVGFSEGAATVTGSFEASLSVRILKTSRTIDQFGGSGVYAGSDIEYTLTISISGTDTATALVVSDPIPENTTYIAGSLTLDGVSLTDEADGDSGDYGQSTAGEITVNIGDMAPPSPDKVITFRVRIN